MENNYLKRLRRGEITQAQATDGIVASMGVDGGLLAQCAKDGNLHGVIINGEAIKEKLNDLMEIMNF